MRVLCFARERKLHNKCIPPQKEIAYLYIPSYTYQMKTLVFSVVVFSDPAGNPARQQTRVDVIVTRVVFISLRFGACGSR